MEYNLNEKKDLLELLLASNDINEIHSILKGWNKNIDNEFYKIYQLIEEVGYTEIFLNNTKLCDKLGINADVLRIYSSGNGKNYIQNRSNFPSYGIFANDIVNLIFLSLSKEEIKEFLEKPASELYSFGLIDDFICELVKNSGVAEDFFKRPTEDLCYLNLIHYKLADLLKETNCVKEFLNRPTDDLCDLLLYEDIIVELVRYARIEKEFLAKPTEELQALDLTGHNLISLIKDANVANEFLSKSPQELNALCLTGNNRLMLNLIADTTKRNRKYSSIGLDPSLTIGIEIENKESIEGNTDYLIKAKKIFHYWETDYDLTLSETGCEIKSPILTDNKKSLEEIYLICEYLQQLRATNIK